MSTTYFLINNDGDIMCCWGGDVYRTNIIEFKSDRPYSPEDVVRMMNKAYRIGADDKAEQIRNVLGIK
jgi:hypothetical protein